MPWFGILLTCMVLQLMLAPVFAGSPLGLQGERMLGAATLVAALFAVKARAIVALLFVPTLLLQIAADYSTSAYALTVAVALRLVFMCFVLALVLWRVLHERHVTGDIVAGVACGYMIIGVIWGDLYVLIEYWRPASFEVPTSFVGADDLRTAFTYFSFITLTTVGYGAIHPMDARTGGLCVAEAIVGQLYLAIMIARMVGLQLSNRPDDESRP